MGPVREPLYRAPQEADYRRAPMSLRTLHTAAVVALIGAALVGCTATAPPEEVAGGASEMDTGTAPSSESDEGSPSDEDVASSFVTVSGTGRYTVGVDLPYGGYQLHGEPDEQPAGCTWAILDADGGVSFANQGSYAFLTDVPEIVTFETTGCPDWEQFE
ncbi:hypothetical protein GCM10010459_23380 [Microbacterium schleiferi]